MGNSVYPVLPGRTWDTTVEPVFNTKVLTAASLNEFRASWSGTPVYNMTLKYDVLRDGDFNGTPYDEWRELIGFFLARNGKFDSFLYENPDDFQVVAQEFGTGDGVTANFNLARTLGAFTERVANVKTITEVTINNTPTEDYVVSSTGVITFDTPPADDDELGWTGEFYYRCRFFEDMQAFQQFMRKLWNAKTVQFVGCLGTKI